MNENLYIPRPTFNVGSPIKNKHSDRNFIEQIEKIEATTESSPSTINNNKNNNKRKKIELTEELKNERRNSLLRINNENCMQRCSTGTGITLERSKHENIVNNNNQNENIIQSSSFLSHHNYLGTINKYPKDVDCVSNASSTHFTMIGIGGSGGHIPLKDSICCRNKITCIVLTMSILIVIGILAAIIYIEYARKFKSKDE